jgi:hypothetical protein
MSSDEESYWRRYDYEFGRGHRVEAEAASVPRELTEEMRLFSLFMKKSMRFCHKRELDLWRPTASVMSCVVA